MVHELIELKKTTINDMGILGQIYNCSTSSQPRTEIWDAETKADSTQAKPPIWHPVPEIKRARKKYY